MNYLIDDAYSADIHQWLPAVLEESVLRYSFWEHREFRLDDAIRSFY